MFGKLNSLHYAWNKTRFRLTFISIWPLIFTISAFAQDRERFAVEFEGGPIWQTRNNVRIPNETGTEFSLVDTLGKGPYGAFRVEAAFDVNERHGFRVIVAPLKISGTSALDKPVLFAGESFDPVYGARPLKRAIQRQLENPLANEILAGRFMPGDVIKVDKAPDGLTFSK